MFRKLATFAVVLASLAVSMGPAAADAQGYAEDEFGVGFFYGNFNQSPLTVLLAGGPASGFCDGEPSVAPARVFDRADGTVDFKVNDKDQPIYLYYTDADAPVWLGQVCADIAVGGAEPEPFAVGTADLKVRWTVVDESTLDVFNSVNGTAIDTDGTIYRVQASADLIAIDGVPQGNPEDFVEFSVTEVAKGR